MTVESGVFFKMKSVVIGTYNPDSGLDEDAEAELILMPEDEFPTRLDTSLFSLNERLVVLDKISQLGPIE